VVHALDEVEGISRFRISSIEPNLLSDEIIRTVAGSQRFMPHFHIPLQSGSNDILALMRRRYRRELYAERVATIRELIPHACIGVDVIVGFPGETETHFEETYLFLNELDISYLHVFTYSEREDTLAAGMPGKVPQAERNRRNEMLRILSEKKRRHFYQKFVGHSREVLWEAEEEQGQMFGFTDNYIKTVAPYQETWVNSLGQVQLTAVNPEGICEVLVPVNA
jgi:threonylcarbamoyladenosine tRNA methylthiotransferase MtaB